MRPLDLRDRAVRRPAVGFSSARLAEVRPRRLQATSARLRPGRAQQLLELAVVEMPQRPGKIARQEQARSLSAGTRFSRRPAFPRHRGYRPAGAPPEGRRAGVVTCGIQTVAISADRSSAYPSPPGGPARAYRGTRIPSSRHSQEVS